VSQFSLLGRKRFGPFFWTQFLGAFNDNLYKNALVIMLGFGAASAGERDALVNLGSALFILPYFLLSAIAGQLADKYEKSRLIRLIKLMEIVVMMTAFIAFFTASVPLLFVVLFLMGTQSTMFGPVKYSILPQHLEEEELVGGNGLVEMGTFVAILVGTIAGSVLVALKPNGPVVVGGCVIAIALAGWAISRSIPAAKSEQHDLKLRFNLFKETWRTIGYAREVDSVFKSILGISWLWFYGALFLAQLPGYVQDVLGGNEGVVTLLMGAFSIGIGTGSMLCERLSGGKIEIGLVPFGCFGMTVFALDLFIASPSGAPAGMVTASMVLQTASGWRVIADLALIGLFGGFFSVPLYAFVQHRSAPEVRSRIIAANNIMNAGFMVVAAILAVALRRAGLTIPQLFLVTAVLNALVGLYIFSLVPEFLMRFIVWMLMHTMYRLRVTNIDKIPDDGAALLVCNHVTFVDALIIAAACRRPIRFVMYYKFFNLPVIRFVFTTAKAIPIAGRREDEALMNKAFDEVADALDAGDLVCIFPEGKLTSDGEMNSFRPGVEKVLERTPVPVVPMALQGMWGSFFSRKGGKAMRNWRGLGSRIRLVCGESVPASEATASVLEDAVKELRGDAV